MPIVDLIESGLGIIRTESDITPEWVQGVLHGSGALGDGVSVTGDPQRDGARAPPGPPPHECISGPVAPMRLGTGHAGRADKLSLRCFVACCSLPSPPVRPELEARIRFAQQDRLTAANMLLTARKSA